MKKMFTLNLFLAIGALLLANFVVDTSFELNKYTFKSSELPSLKVQNTSPAATLESSPDLAVVEVQIEEEREELDFTPRSQIVAVQKEKEADSKIEFVKFKNKKTVLEKRTDIKPVTRENLEAVEVAGSSKFELSYQEIPTQKKITMKKFEHVSWKNVSYRIPNYNIKIAQKNIRQDRISTAVAATEKSSAKTKNDYTISRVASKNFPRKGIEKHDKVKDSDDFVFFTYGEDSEVSGQKSNAGKESVSKSLLAKKSEKSKSITTVSTQRDVMNEPILAMIEKEFSPKKKQKKRKRLPQLDKRSQKSLSPPPAGNGMIASSKSKSFECLEDKRPVRPELSSYKLELSEIDYSNMNYEKIRNFELRFNDDLNETLRDNGEGVINHSLMMTGEMSLRRGIVYAKGYFPTAIDMAFEVGETHASIPMFTLDSFDELLVKERLRGDGAHLLVELDDLTEDVDIDLDKRFEKKLYLNNHYKVVARDNSDYRFVLFVGVEPGNIILNFRRSDTKLVTKLLYLAEQQIYYEPNFYAAVKNDKLNFYQEGPFSRCKSLLNIDADKVKTWSYESYIKKESLNQLIIPKMIYPLGSRKYFEVSYEEINESIFVGRWGEQDIVVPTEEYIQNILGKFTKEQSQNSCIVQLNIEKTIREIEFNGESLGQSMNMEINVLDRDGKFYKDFSADSQRVFLMGEDEGIIGVKIKYTDGSYQYIQSFCNSSTYIVEQL